MVGRQGMMPKQQASRRIDSQEVPRMAYALYETAWADAWPHLDDWFKTEALLRQYGMNRLITRI